MRKKRKIRVVPAILILLAVIAVTAVVVWAAPTPAPVAPPVKATAPHVYKPAAKLKDVFYIGMPGKSGCYVCHGNDLLKKNVKGKIVSYFIDENVMESSVHKDVACTACHTDFTSKTHKPVPKNWRLTAGLACIRCHDHKKQYEKYIGSVHGQKSLKGEKGATCADCHGSHDIKSYKDAGFKAAFNLNGLGVCGKCHKKEWLNYDDYYHGRAYRRGAADAPACWVCHGAHDILPAKEPNSMVSKQRLRKTCEICHAGSTRTFLDYAPAIHGTAKLKAENPLVKGKDFLRKMVGGVVSSIEGLFGRPDKTAAKNGQ